MAESNYSEMREEAVVVLAQNGDIEATDYILNSYKNAVSSRARPYFLMGADHEDLIQEGMIGLYKALMAFDAVHYDSFRKFAELKIQNQIMQAVRASSRQKHIPLNYYVSLSQPLFDEGASTTLMDALSEQVAQDPMEVVIGLEERSKIESHLLPKLSELEQQVFYPYLEGISYQEIAEKLGRTPKSIDNAVQRIKFKMADALRADGILLESEEKDEKRAQRREQRRESFRTSARKRANQQAMDKRMREQRIRRRELGRRLREKSAWVRALDDLERKRQLTARRAYARVLTQKRQMKGFSVEQTPKSLQNT